MITLYRQILLALALGLLQGLAACEKSAPAPRGTPAQTSVADLSGSGEDDDGDEDDGGGEDDGGEDDGGGDGIGQLETDKPVPPLSDEDALAFIKEQCVSCHHATTGSVKSFWALDPETLDKKSLLTSTMAPTVYYSLVMRAKDIVGGKPAAMPPKKFRAENQERLRGLVSWFEKEATAAVAEARARYGKGGETDAGGVGVILNYKCSEPETFRGYIRRVTNDLFGREPTADELALGANGPDKPTTAKDRAKVADRLFSNEEWKQEFMASGLKRFAAKLSGANDILPLPGELTPEQTADLKEELYQILKADMEEIPYKDILLSRKVMVTPRTAPLYDCDAPDGEWGPCEMTRPRGSYFTTFSYLRSKQSSFLVENNNYGRAALLFFIIRGDVFRSALNEGGGGGVKALPACLKSDDHRGIKGTDSVAPFGSMAIPSFANLCQSCHIQRQMAAGSILFRPFDKVGHMYGNLRLIASDPDFAEATSEKMVNVKDGVETQVDEEFLRLLLEESDLEKSACVPGEQGEKDLTLKTVGDLAKYLIGDGTVLAGGLARHLPRALSNLDNTSEEIIIKINKAWNDGKGKLGPVFQAYIASETYACKKR